MPSNNMDYFHTQAFSQDDFDRVPPVETGCRVTPLIDGAEYFPELYRQIEDLEGNDCALYIANWLFDFDFTPLSNKPSIGDLIVEKAEEGVDVKVLLWCSDYLLNLTSNQSVVADLAAWSEEAQGYLRYDVQWTNLLSAERLRAQSTALDRNVLLNYLNHDKGSVHIKGVFIKNHQYAVGFTGGIDLTGGRYSERIHDATRNSWHDIMVKVEGSVVIQFFQMFKIMWNSIFLDSSNPEFIYNPCEYGADVWQELLGNSNRKVYAKSTAVVPGGTASDLEYGFAACIDDDPDFYPSVLDENDNSSADCIVQSLITFPASDVILNTEKGLYQTRNAFAQAISQATEYIYIEDQMVRSRELFGLLKNALLNNASLKLIMLNGKIDPADPSGLSHFSLRSLNNYLYDDSINDRILLCSRPYQVIHSKVWIIDDKWAYIGSANMTNRSLYTDVEHGISFSSVDQQRIADFRCDLWAEHFHINDIGQFLELYDLNNALPIWNNSWGSSTLPYELPLFAKDTIINSEDGSNWVGEYIVQPGESFGPQDGFTVPSPEDGYTEDDLQEMVGNIELYQQEYALKIIIKSGANLGHERSIVAYDPLTRWVQFDDFLPNANNENERVRFELVVWTPLIIDISLPTPDVVIDITKFGEWLIDPGDHPVNPINESTF